MEDFDKNYKEFLMSTPNSSYLKNYEVVAIEEINGSLNEISEIIVATAEENAETIARNGYRLREQTIRKIVSVKELKR